MNRDTLLTLYRYNAFANQLLFETLDQLEGVDLSAASPSRDTIVNLLRHSLIVEVAYLSAAKQSEFDREAIPSDAPSIRTGMREVSAEQTTYLTNVTEADLAETRTWFGITLPINQLLTQAVLHSIQHRSEISLLLSQQSHTMPDFDILKFFIHESGQEWPF